MINLIKELKKFIQMVISNINYKNLIKSGIYNDVTNQKRKNKLRYN